MSRSDKPHNGQAQDGEVAVIFRDSSTRRGVYNMASDREGGRGALRPVMRGAHGAVTSGHALATAAGQDVMRRGGNAVDAGVAMGLCLCVVEHDRTSFGGVAPIIIYDAASRRVTTISGLGCWPKAASLEFFWKRYGGRFEPGIGTSVTPVAMDSWLEALTRYGTMSFADVCQAALLYAHDGFPVSEVLREDIIEYEEGFRNWPATAEIFTPGGMIPGVGQLLKQPILARTIERLIDVEKGSLGAGREAAISAVRQYFYEGPIAEQMVSFSRSQGGLLTMDDLKSFRAREEPPAALRFGDIEIHTCGPWTQGPVLLQILGLLRGFDLVAMGHNSTAYIHTITESVKLAMWDRDAYYGDPDFVHVPLEELLSEAYCSERRKMIRADRAGPGIAAPGRVSSVKPYFGRTPPHEEELVTEGDQGLDTTTLAAIDQAGNIFCSAPSDPALRHMVIPELGFGISPRGTQSWLHPNHPAVLAPGKRPRLTTNPVLALKNGKPHFALCTPGGDVQPQAMLQALLNVSLFGMNVQQAAEAPRFASFSFPNSFYPHRIRPGELAAEARISSTVFEELAAKGHGVKRWPDWSGNAGGVCMIVRDEQSGVMHAGADPRRDAYAAAW